MSLLIFISLVSCSNSTKNPSDIVRSFIEDYYTWNNEAMKHSERERDDSGKAMKTAQERYQKLIEKYCLPGFKGQPISFGSESSHEPIKEVIASEEITGNKAIVKTKHTKSRNFVSDYEYRFVKIKHRWYLEAVDYVDRDGKYPSL